MADGSNSGDRFWDRSQCYNSGVWHWYRPGGDMPIADVGRFFVSRQLAILGCSPELADDAFQTAAAA